MTKDQLEFAISQHLDGTLPPEERAALERLLATDADAQRLLEEYRSLDLVAKGALPLPNVNWNKLSASISDAVATTADSSSQLLTDEEEYAITQYLDGDLAADEVAAVEARLANDVSARDAAREHRSLTGLLRRAMPVPAVDYDRLSREISELIDEEATRSRYSLTWLRAAPRLAMAACLLLVLSLAFWFYLNTDTTTGGRNVQQIAEITGPAPEQATGAPVAQVTIDMDASEQFARTRLDDYGTDVIVASPSRVQLAASSLQFFHGGAFPQ
jgi:anti-sigma factor RsiW